MTPLGTTYVLTCGQCGQTWQRRSVVEGQPMECIFCGWRGRLSVGTNVDAAPGSPPRVEAWLIQ